ncbi:MAG: hypothetical protein OXJ52_10015 [Oligoflexia bacterium]|nr:hypothetical protein [Oligoflexia bacterium]
MNCYSNLSRPPQKTELPQKRGQESPKLKPNRHISILFFIPSSPHSHKSLALIETEADSGNLTKRPKLKQNQSSKTLSYRIQLCKVKQDFKKSFKIKRYCQP